MNTGSQVFIRASLVLLVGASVFLLFMASHRNTGPEIPDEKAAGLALLVEKQSGPGYFKPTAAPDKNALYITREEAINQISRVLKDRNWEPARTQEIETLIDRGDRAPALSDAR